MNEVAKREKPRLIQGIIAKCVDGRWADSDGLPLPTELLVVGITRALQRWNPVDHIIDQPGKPLPDVDELNAKIPENEWELGLDAKPAPPWKLNWVVYLLNPETADTYTFLNSTAGARIAVERLEDKFHWMRRMRGAGVVPIVRLDSRPMKTNFGQKMRPEFSILEWRDIGTAPGIEQKATPQIEQQKSAADFTAANPSKPAVKTKPGKPVKPVELDDELDDSIPF